MTSRSQLLIMPLWETIVFWTLVLGLYNVLLWFVIFHRAAFGIWLAFFYGLNCPQTASFVKEVFPRVLKELYYLLLVKNTDVNTSIYNRNSYPASRKAVCLTTGFGMHRGLKVKQVLEEVIMDVADSVISATPIFLPPYPAITLMV